MMNVLLKKRAQNLKKNKKGFTLVELIVVLVILAILAAIAIPSMMKYVNDARDKTLIAEARNAYTAAQAIASEKLGVNAGSIVIKGSADGGPANAATSDAIGKSGESDAKMASFVTVGATDTSKEWITLMNAYMDGTLTADGATVVVKIQQTASGDIPAGKVIRLIYTNGSKQVDYQPGVEPVVTDVQP